MSELFSEEKLTVDTELIPPDYSPSEDDDDIDETIIPDEEEDIISATEPLKEKLETENYKEHKEVDNNMGNTPFGTPQQTPSWSTPAWGQSSGGFGSNNGGNTPFFGTQQSRPSFGGFGSGTSTWGSGSTQKEPLMRNKAVLFIPFLDGLVAPYNADRPGIAPRDIYDLTPRFDVWNKVAAFNPQRVYIISPLNILQSANGSRNTGEVTLSYFCYSLSAYLRCPVDRCQVIVPSMIGQPTEMVIGEVLASKYSSIKKEDCLYIGVYSGNGTSDVDKRAAEACGIDYIDIVQLLNNTI